MAKNEASQPKRSFDAASWIAGGDRQQAEFGASYVEARRLESAGS